jgi:hypothetical protein
MGECVEYDTGKWDCPVSFIQRDYLDPYIKKEGLEVFDVMRWGAKDRLYVRFKGRYDVPEGWVITGIKGIGARMKDWVSDPQGNKNAKINYMITHFRIGNLSKINEYSAVSDIVFDDDGNYVSSTMSDDAWETSQKWVRLDGGTDGLNEKGNVLTEQEVNKLVEEWEFETWEWNQSFIRGYFLTGITQGQGFLAPVSSGTPFVNTYITVQAKHYLQGHDPQFQREYTFGDKRAGITKPAGLNIPDHRRTISGIVFDSSVVFFFPFYEITNILIKDLSAELPDNSYDNSDGGSTNTIPVKTDPAVDPAELDGSDGSSSSGIGNSSGTGSEVGGESPGIGGKSPGSDTTAPVTPDTRVPVDVVIKEKTTMDTAMDFWENNKAVSVLIIISIVILMSYSMGGQQDEMYPMMQGMNPMMMQGSMPYGYN